jgi:hypothetical protein
MLCGNASNGKISHLQVSINSILYFTTKAFAGYCHISTVMCSVLKKALVVSQFLWLNSLALVGKIKPH